MPSCSEVRDALSLDKARSNCLRQLHERTGRNVITYYSGFLQKDPELLSLGIDDADKNGFMACVYQLDLSLGCDLLLHTPGGDLAATESLVDYLHKMFGGDIRAIVPQIAMSAGTMIACACREIVMGKHSNIGPVDPQIGGVAAQGVIDEFEEAREAARNDPETVPLWQAILQGYTPSLLFACRNAVALSDELVLKWLQSNMFSGRKNPEAAARRALDKLGSHAANKTHSRHIHIEEAREIGLNVLSLEDDQKLQDLVLTIHHCYMHAFAEGDSPLKIVENHCGVKIATARA